MRKIVNAVQSKEISQTTDAEITAISLPRLTIELVPATCWFSNVRSNVDPETWDRLRRQTYRDVNRKCAICGGVGPKWPVECHELWEYDDEWHVQKLVGLTGLCPACHEVKHMGNANIRGRGEAAMQHLAHINGWTTPESKAYVTETNKVWRERSMFEWTLDLTWLERLGIHVEAKRGRDVTVSRAQSLDTVAGPKTITASTPSVRTERGTANGRQPKAPSREQSPQNGFSADTRKPSEVMDNFWVEARRKNSDYPAHTERGGKWMLFAPQTEVDDAWASIVAALESGQLGNSAKVATALPNPNAADPAMRVICIYTYDGDDEVDIWRVRDAIRRLGFTTPLYWKADQATRDGQYQVRGYRRVSRYRG